MWPTKFVTRNADGTAQELEFALERKAPPGPDLAELREMLVANRTLSTQFAALLIVHGGELRMPKRLFEQLIHNEFAISRELDAETGEFVFQFVKAPQLEPEPAGAPS